MASYRCGVAHPGVSVSCAEHFFFLSSPSAKPSELLGQAGLLQNRISGVTRLYSVVDGKPRIGQGRVPDFMVALTLTLLATTCLMQDAL